MCKLLWMSLTLIGCGGASEAKPAAGATTPTESASPAAACIDKANAGAAAGGDATARVTVKHVLVKHAEAERAPDAITRSRGEACLRALEALDALKGGTDFDQVVAKYSDEEGAATRGGMLGAIEREDVDPAFAAAAFSLQPDQASNVVESKFGFHVILRTE